MIHSLPPIIFPRAVSAGPIVLSTLPLTIYLDGSSYAAGTWTGLASAGTSASHSATTAGSDPTVGANLNGIPTVNFVQASGQYLNMSFPLSALITTSAWSFWCLLKTGATGGTDRGIFGDPGTRTLRITISNASTAFAAFQLDSAVHGNGAIAAANTDGVWELYQAKYDGTAIWVRRDSTAWNGGVVGNITTPMTPTCTVGRNALLADSFNGQMASMGLSQSLFSDATMDGIKATLNTRFGLAL